MNIHHGRHLTIERKVRIIQLRDLGHNPTSIVRTLDSEGGKGVSRTTVYRVLKKWEEHRTVGDLPQPIKPFPGITLAMCDYVNRIMEQNNETTATDLSRLVNSEFNVSFSKSKIKELRHRLGWIASKTRYCQMVREANRAKRLDFARKCIETNDQFDDVLWSDECNIQLDHNGVITFHRWWEQCPQKGKPKHPFKVSVWAAISKRGASPILTFTGIMEKTFFCDKILVETLKPFVDAAFPDGHRFMQDNDPKHTSLLGRETMEKNGINWWKTPAESPDCNPIENLWHEMKHHFRTRVKPRTEEQLLQGISEFWGKLTAWRCQRYINHIQRVLPVVVEREGRATGF